MQGALRGTVRESAGILEAIHALQLNDGEDLVVIRPLPAGFAVVGLLGADDLLEKVMGGALAELADRVVGDLMIPWPAHPDADGPLGQTLRRLSLDLHDAANVLPV